MTIWGKMLLVISILAFIFPVMGIAFTILSDFKRFKEAFETAGGAFFGMFILIVFAFIFVVFAMVVVEVGVYE